MHGYYAAGAGKLFHTLQWGTDSMNDPAAWDEYFRAGRPPLPPWPRPRLVDDREAGLTPGRPLGGEANRQYFGGAPLDVPDEATSDYQLVDWAIEQLRQHRDKPRFIGVGLFRPHIPFEVPRKYFDLYPLERLQLPEHRPDDLDDAFPHARRAWHAWIQENKLWPRLLQAYLASISYVDAQVGRLLDALEASPRREQTIVVLWSDHGFHVGEKENCEKFALWEQTTRVPLFIVAPGVGRGGTRTRQPASLVDLYPTLCELAGLPVPRQCDGVSLLPQLRNPETPRERPAITSHVDDSIYVLRDGQMRKERTPDASRQPIPASHAVRDVRYRYIKYYNGFEELYDLDADPHEFTNRARDPALGAVKKRLAALLPARPAFPVTIPANSKMSTKGGTQATPK
jgi:arylsulfatase A-like enzyme